MNAPRVVAQFPHTGSSAQGAQGMVLFSVMIGLPTSFGACPEADPAPHQMILDSVKLIINTSHQQRSPKKTGSSVPERLVGSP